MDQSQRFNVRLLIESMTFDEDAPVNAVGSGAVAGTGVGDAGEPGVYVPVKDVEPKKRKRKHHKPVRKNTYVAKRKPKSKPKPKKKDSEK